MENLNIDHLAAELAKEHGSFTAWFDAEQNDRTPEYAPWVVSVDNAPCACYAFSGFTLESAIQFAMDEMAKELHESGDDCCVLTKM